MGATTQIKLPIEQTEIGQRHVLLKRKEQLLTDIDMDIDIDKSAGRLVHKLYLYQKPKGVQFRKN